MPKPHGVLHLGKAFNHTVADVRWHGAFAFVFAGALNLDNLLHEKEEAKSLKPGRKERLK